MLYSFEPSYFSSTPRGILLGLKSYHFSFNGKEKDDETYGEGNAYDFGSRIYNSRLGKWMSVDSRSREIPSESPYVGIGNKPIKFYDPDGNKIICDDRNTQQEILKAINSQALGTFAFNEKGELFLKSKIGDEKKYSKYFQNQLIKAINDDDAIFIRKAEKAYDSEKKEYENVSDWGEGLTLKETTQDDDPTTKDIKTAKVFYTGRTYVDKDQNGDPLELSKDEIIMHELVGHAIPFVTKSDSGDAVVNENKVRIQTHKKLKYVDGKHRE
jgi:RHS repeat-associated protein